MQNQTLTKSEMTVMNILWEMPEGGTVNEVQPQDDAGGNIRKYYQLLG